ncbi:MAG TPA: hypothetical protein VMJ10_04160 [Kofleriaceae bacterium]|nr:hypothetical protein [Kofleriaceae bacterium]
MTRIALVLVGLAVVACEGSKSHELDHDRIHVIDNARLRTDTVGEGKWEEQATFVLVDAANDAGDGAYVTLAGELDDASGGKVGDLRAQSLWIPAGEQRTFALVDREHKPRPTAAGAKLFVRGATAPASPPPASVGEQRQLVDQGRIVVQGTLHNTAPRAGNIMVIASFHDGDGRPMTRPFSMVPIDGNGSQAVQFVGPPGSKQGAIFVGDSVY